jgi:ABC-2 type transport system permease protein
MRAQLEYLPEPHGGAGMNTLDGIRLVTRREVRERTREKSFLISTAVTLVILCAFIVIPKVFFSDRTTTWDIGLVGGGSAQLARPLETQAPLVGARVRVQRPAGVAEAEAALRDGDLDLAIVDGGQLLAESDPDDRLVALVQAASRLARAQEALAEARLSERQIADALAPPPLPLRTLEASDPERRANRAIAFPAVLLLYGQLIGYGYTVAMGVVEEKSTRVVEVLLATIRPVQLLAGKVIGVGLVGLMQLLLIGVVGLAVAVGIDAIDLPPGAFGTLGMVLVWFLLGYAFYSVLFAVAGAIVSRQEEVQNTSTPLSLVLVASFLAAISALGNPDGPIAAISTYLPPVAPLIMPVRMAGGAAAGWEIAVSALITLAAIVVLVPFSARLYEGAVLRTGARVKLRSAWAASRG